MAKQQNRPFPSKEDLLTFIGSRDGKAGKREIARAFGIKGGDRVALKNMLRELADDGQVERRRRKLTRAGHLPSVVLVDITGRDSDGELIALPTEWDEEAHGPAPKIRLVTPRRQRPGEAAGVNDRALIRVEETGEADEAIRHSGRVIKIIDRGKHRALGVFRALPGGGGRLSPIDKKQLGRELNIPPGATGDAQEGDLVAVDVTKHGRFGLPTARVKERLGSLKSERAVSMIAIHAHGLPHVFRRETLAEAEAAAPPTLEGRQDWRELPLVTIDPADAQGPRRRGPRRAPTATRAIPAASSSASPSPTSRTTYVRAPRSTARRWSAATPSISPTASCRCCPNASPTSSARSSPTRTAPPWRCAWWWTRDGRKRSHTFHRVLMRSCGAPALRPGAGGDRRPHRRHDGAARRSRSSRHCMPPIGRWRRRATRASRSTSTFPSARSCSRATAPSTG